MNKDNSNLPVSNLIKDLDIDISEALHQWADFDVPESLYEDALCQFDLAHKRKLTAAWLMGIFGTMAISTPILWLLLLNFTDATKLFAQCARVSAVGLEFLMTMWSNLPEMGTGIMLGLWVVLFVCSIGLIKIFQLSHPPLNDYVAIATGGQP